MCIRDRCKAFGTNVGEDMRHDTLGICLMATTHTEVQEWRTEVAVSYTHLDVYKRQFPNSQERGDEANTLD